jgi:FlaA1/EpsC-like NDP-sugar epimerase
MTHEIHKNPTNPQQFKGKTVVITGGGGVLCSTMAEAMAGSGARYLFQCFFCQISFNTQFKKITSCTYTIQNIFQYQFKIVTAYAQSKNQ